MKIIVFGAHPDDCDIFAGGTAIKYALQGHQVKFVSLTNGDAGHHEIGGAELAKRRYAETQASAKVMGIEYDVLDNHDGELMPTLDVRRDIIQLIREWQADIVFLNRPNDYHPDHRYASMVVQDAAYLVCVPNICPDVPALKENPYFFYFWDPFQKPYPLQNDVVVGIDDVMDTKWKMIDCHESQMYEWLPYIEKMKMPDEEENKLAWLKREWSPFLERITESCRKELIQKYGKEDGALIQMAECFEICEYGKHPSDDDVKKLFPFE